MPFSDAYYPLFTLFVDHLYFCQSHNYGWTQINTHSGKLKNRSGDDDSTTSSTTHIVTLCLINISCPSAWFQSHRDDHVDFIEAKNKKWNASSYLSIFIVNSKEIRIRKINNLCISLFENRYNVRKLIFWQLIENDLFISKTQNMSSV